jgi:hypothetical protein
MLGVALGVTSLVNDYKNVSTRFTTRKERVILWIAVLVSSAIVGPIVGLMELYHKMNIKGNANELIVAFTLILILWMGIAVPILLTMADTIANIVAIIGIVIFSGLLYKQIKRKIGEKHE